MKKILFVAIPLLLLAAGGFYYAFNKPHRNVEQEAASVVLSSMELFNQYSENEKLSDSLYLNKIIEVKGVVGEIIQDQKGANVLVLKEDGEIFGVVCSVNELDEESTKKTASMKPGDVIILKGICSGFDSDVKLNKCVIVNNTKSESSI